MRKPRVSFVVTVFVVSSIAMVMPNSPPAAQSDPLKNYFRVVKSFSAAFSQTVLDETLTVIDESSGTMWINRPGRFRWNYQTPSAQEIVSDGRRVWIYDAELEQVTIRNYSAALGETPASILAGEGDLDSRYAVTNLGDQGGLIWFSLVSHREDSQFTDVRLAFAENQLQIIELVDGLDQITRINLADIKNNPTINQDLFHFDPPSGIDIIDESE